MTRKTKVLIFVLSLWHILVSDGSMTKQEARKTVCHSVHFTEMLPFDLIGAGRRMDYVCTIETRVRQLRNTMDISRTIMATRYGMGNVTVGWG